jgi:hypothetical protein
MPRKSNKDYNFYIATWNVQSVPRAGMLKRNWKNIELALQKLKRYVYGKWSVGCRELNIDL